MNLIINPSETVVQCNWIFESAIEINIHVVLRKCFLVTDSRHWVMKKCLEIDAVKRLIINVRFSEIVRVRFSIHL